MKIDIRAKLGKFEKKVKSFLNLEISFTEKYTNDTHAEQSIHFDNAMANKSWIPHSRAGVPTQRRREANLFFGQFFHENCMKNLWAKRGSRVPTHTKSATTSGRQPREEGVLTYRFADFSRKLHKNERIWTERERLNHPVRCQVHLQCNFRHFAQLSIQNKKEKKRKRLLLLYLCT